jgi:sulfopyruvate decarboxylase alpha subunit
MNQSDAGQTSPARNDDGLATIPWQDQIYPILKSADIRHIAYVPDAGHAKSIESACTDPDMQSVVLTTEEEGLGYLAGAWLGGERGALLLQSSGVGNCINTLALQSCARFPLLMLVTMRGDWAEFNPWQNPMGQQTENVLNVMGVLTWRADRPDQVAPLLKGAITMAFDGDTACAVILGQQLIGAKEWNQ